MLQFTTTSTKIATSTPAKISSSIVPLPWPSGVSFLRHEVHRMAGYCTLVRFSLTLPSDSIWARGLRHHPLSLERHITRVGFVDGAGMGVARMDRGGDGAGR